MEDIFQNKADELPLNETVACSIIGADGSVREEESDVIAEHELEVSVNGVRAFVLSCTPCDLTELVTGRLYTERIISSTEDIVKLYICKAGHVAEVSLREDIEFNPYTGAEPTCCTGNRQLIDGNRKLETLPKAEIESGVVFELAKRFKEDSRLHKSTGGAHSCYIRFEDGSVSSFEDIGRHNALDKAVGHMLLQGWDAEKTILFTTGRVAYDMVVKTVAAGIPVLVSKAVPTTAAVALAREYGLTLICRAWPDSYGVVKGSLCPKIPV